MMDVSDVGVPAGESAALGGRPSPEQLAAWRELYQGARAVPREQRIRLLRVPTEGTRAAFAHGTSCGPCVTWRLDHVLFTPRTLHLARWWHTLEATPDEAAIGTPNHASPSDHIPVAAAFDVSPPPSLPAAEAAELLMTVRQLLARQAEARAALDAELTAQISALEAVEAETEAAAARAAASSAEASEVAAAEEEDAAGQKKRSKKSKPPKKIPSEAMRGLIRSRRERERELASTHQAECKALYDALRWVERDALEAASVQLPGV